MLRPLLGLVPMIVLLAVACQAAPVSAPAAKPPQQKLIIAIQPTLASAEMLEKAKPLEKFLEDQLKGVDVEIYVPLSQAGVVEALRFEQADVAFMGAWAAHLSVQLAGADLVLAEVRSVIHEDQKVEAPYYFSYWVVPKASPYKSLVELKGKSACFSSAISTSGYVAPMGRLIEVGLIKRPEKGEADPKTFFSQVLFGGGYAQCWEALKSGQVDVSVIAGDVSEKLYNDVLANTRVLERQGPIPSHGVLVRKGLSEPLKSQVVEALLALRTPEQQELMRAFISSLFVRFERSTAEKHLGSLKQYLDNTGLVFVERIGR